MSIRSMASGDLVVKQTLSYERGIQFGNKLYAEDDASPLECNIQGMSFNQALQFDATGERVLFTVYFAEDPAITTAHQLRVTKRGGVAYEDLFLRVLSVEEEGRPGQSLLWYALCEFVTSRVESLEEPPDV